MIELVFKDVLNRYGITDYELIQKNPFSFVVKTDPKFHKAAVESIYDLKRHYLTVTKIEWEKR